MHETQPTRYRILHIEDQAADIEIVRRFFDLAGAGEFAISAIHTLQAALAVLDHQQYDLILLDQNLPDSDESHTFREVRAKAKGTPIVVLTGFGDEELGRQWVGEGAQDFLVKGRFDAQLLVRVVHYALERWRLIRENEKLRQKEQREKELANLQEYAFASVTPKHDGLSESAPDLFRMLVDHYADLLDQSLENQLYKQSSKVYREASRHYISELVNIDAGPREVVQIHSASLEAKMRYSNSEIRLQAYVEEGRHLLLATMGELVRAYQKIARSQYGPLIEV